MTTPPSPYGPSNQPHNGFSGYGAPSGQPTGPYGSQPQQGFGAHGGAYGGQQPFGGQQQFSGQQQFGGYGSNSFGQGGPPPQSPGSGKNNSGGNGPLVWFIAAMLLIIVIGGATFFGLRGSDDSEEANATDNSASSSSSAPSQTPTTSSPRSTSSSSSSSSSSTSKPPSSSSASSTTAGTANPDSIKNSKGQLDTCKMDKATQKALRISRVEVKEADQANIVNRCWVDRTPERARIEVVLLKEEPALNDDAQSYSEVPGWTATKDNGSSVFFQKGRDGWIGIATPSPGSEYYAFINEFTKLLKDAELL